MVYPFISATIFTNNNPHVRVLGDFFKISTLYETFPLMKKTKKTKNEKSWSRFGIWVWKAAWSCSRWWSSHQKLSGMEGYRKLLLQVPTVLTLSSEAGFGSLWILTCSKNKEAYWGMDPRLQQPNQKQHQTQVTWTEAALLSWGSISCEHLGPHSESCVPRTPPPPTLPPSAHTPPACLDHPSAWEVRSRRSRWRLGLPLSAAVQDSVPELLRPVLL